MLPNCPWQHFKPLIWPEELMNSPYTHTRSPLCFPRILSSHRLCQACRQTSPESVFFFFLSSRSSKCQPICGIVPKTHPPVPLMALSTRGLKRFTLFRSLKTEIRLHCADQWDRVLSPKDMDKTSPTHLQSLKVVCMLADP